MREIDVHPGGLGRPDGRRAAARPGAAPVPDPRARRAGPLPSTPRASRSRHELLEVDVPATKSGPHVDERAPERMRFDKRTLAATTVAARVVERAVGALRDGVFHCRRSRRRTRCGRRSPTSTRPTRPTRRRRRRRRRATAQAAGRLGHRVPSTRDSVARPRRATRSAGRSRRPRRGSSSRCARRTRTSSAGQAGEDSNPPAPSYALGARIRRRECFSGAREAAAGVGRWLRRLFSGAARRRP